MPERNTGGPAFPQVDLKDNYGMLVPDRQVGMTLRDYFAAKAMQGIVADSDHMGVAKIAEWAYSQADAMLKARAE